MDIEVLDDFDKDLKPRSKPQEIFHSLPGEIKERMYGGAAGGGKSHSIVTDPLYRKCHQIYGFQGKIWRRSFPQIKESLWPEMQKWYPRFGFIPNEQNHSWTHTRTKSTIACGFLDKDSDALKHDSAAFDYLGFEELTQFTEFMYTYLLHRNRPTVAGWSAYCNSAATPGDIGNVWVRRRFVEPDINGFRVIEGIFNGKTIRRIFIPAKAKDNPVLMSRDPDYVNRLEMLPEALRRAKLLGDWWAFQGQVFDEFRHFRYPDEPENALHVVDPFSIPDWWPKLTATDWGFTHGNYVCWGAVSPNGELIVYRDYLAHFTPIKVWGSEARRLSQYDGNLVRHVVDPIVFAQQGAERTLAEQIEEATGWTLDRADNDRIGGKMLIHELLRWKAKGERFEPKPTDQFNSDLAQRLLRLKGMDSYRSYVAEFESDEIREELPKVKIFNTCQPTIEAIQSAVYDDSNKAGKAEDVKKVDGDDPYDGFRYLCKSFELYISSAKEEFDNRCELERVYERVNRTNDYNTFYNQLAIIEARDKSDIRSQTKYRRVIDRKHSRVIVH